MPDTALFEASQAQAKRSPERRRLRAGQVVEGPVVAITDDAIFVDVGQRMEARLDKASMLDAEGRLQVAVGDPVRATVVDAGGRGAPILEVSLGGKRRVDIRDLELAVQAGTPVEGEVVKAVKAGLEVSLGGVRAFCPASHVELGYAGELERYVGQRHFFRVLEVRDGGRSVVVSRKALLEAERKQQAAALASRLEVGADFDGIVQTIQPYGVFVDLGGLQGLVHVSELTHGRVASPSDVVSVGEKVRVRVLSIEPAASGDPADMRIGLSMRALVQPAAGELEQSEIITATVTKAEGHGLHVETPAGPGFVPAGELALPPGSDPRRTYGAGDVLDVVVLRSGGGKLRFSAKAVEDVEARRAFAAFRSGTDKAGEGFGSLGDLLRGKVRIDEAPRPGASERAPAPAKPDGAPQGRRREPRHKPTTRRR